jgi:XTP/dITP diphosphohydrolase
VTNLFIATGNAHKVQEIRAVLGSAFTVFSQRDANVRLEPEETGATFAENARIKAVTWAAYFAADVCNLNLDYVLADDSGLEVDALGGAPGVHSARFAALDDGRQGNSPDAENNAKLLRLLADVPAERRAARFRCVLALTPVASGEAPAALAAATRTLSGACEGSISATTAGGGHSEPVSRASKWHAAASAAASAHVAVPSKTKFSAAIISRSSTRLTRF